MDTRSQIREYMKNNGHQIAFVANKLVVSRSHLSRVLNCHLPLSGKILNQLKNMWPDAEFYEETEDKEKAKNLFKD